MAHASSGRTRPRHAITDLFDEERGTFLVQYPILLVLALALVGVAAFGVTGFFGYQDTAEPHFTRVVFQQAWPLFLWFCALLVTLQVSIFRDVSLRGRLIATLIVSLLAIIFIGITYFNKSLPDILQQLLQGHRFILTLANSQTTYVVANFGLLAIFWLDTVRRWARRARGEAPNPAVAIGIDDERPAHADALPSMQELVSGDLIAGAVLALLLGALFSINLLPSIVHPQGVHITTCTLSWSFGHCGVGATVADPPTLTFLDLIQTLIYLPVGLLVLALSATVSGFGAVGGVSDSALDEAAPQMQPGLMASGGTAPIAEDVAATVINTLKSALDRRLRLLASNLALSLRSVAWPGLLLLATYGLAQLATYVQLYLHSPKHFQDVLSYVVPAVAWGLGALLSTVFSAALMLFRWRVAENTLRFLGLIGFIMLLTFWIFSLALWGFNELLLLTNASQRHPFDPPSFLTGLSFASLVVFGLAFFVRQTRRTANAARIPVLAGAGQRASSASGASGSDGLSPQQ